MGFIGNPNLLELLSVDITDKIDRVIAACVQDKADIVARDTYDKGERQKLNLGHTVGHAMEALSEYKIHHGSAVASGMHVITKAAAVRGACPADAVTLLDGLLEKYGLDPYIYERFTAEDMYSSALHDKKMRGDTITVVIPVEKGRSELFTYPAAELLSIIKDGAAR